MRSLQRLRGVAVEAVGSPGALIQYASVIRTRRSLPGYLAVLLVIATVAFSSVAASAAATDLEGLRVVLVPVAEGLDSPTFVTHAGDGSGRLYALEKAGRVRVIEADGALRPEPLLDLTAETMLEQFEQGMLGLAFHPRFEENGRFFVNYTREPDGATMISEYQVVDGRVDANAVRQIIVIPQPGLNHNAGMMLFDDLGYLLVSTGDGSQRRSESRDGSQRLDSYLGKILRFDIDAGEAYAAPSPESSMVEGGVHPEILAYGLRNPWRFSLDSETGYLFIGDVGQSLWEEVNVVPPSGTPPNFGWNIVEGPQCDAARPFCRTDPFTAPVIAFPHDEGAAIVGGYVYRGPSQPLLDGVYVFADFVGGEIWGASARDMIAGGAERFRLGAPAERGRIWSFGVDEAGEILATTSAGAILRLAAREVDDS